MQKMWCKMKTRLLVICLIMIGFVIPVSAQDQLLSENPEEPNQFGYFVLAMSVAIVGSFIVLRIKKWRIKK